MGLGVTEADKTLNTNEDVSAVGRSGKLSKTSLSGRGIKGEKAGTGKDDTNRPLNDSLEVTCDSIVADDQARTMSAK